MTTGWWTGAVLSIWACACGRGATDPAGGAKKLLDGARLAELGGELRVRVRGDAASRVADLKVWAILPQPVFEAGLVGMEGIGAHVRIELAPSDRSAVAGLVDTALGKPGTDTVLATACGRITPLRTLFDTQLEATAPPSSDTAPVPEGFEHEDELMLAMLVEAGREQQERIRWTPDLWRPLVLATAYEAACDVIAQDAWERTIQGNASNADLNRIAVAAFATWDAAAGEPMCAKCLTVLLDLAGERTTAAERRRWARSVIERLGWRPEGRR